MKKTIKVIDLLNLVYKKKNPKRIIYYHNLYEYDEEYQDYKYDDDNFLFQSLYSCVSEPLCQEVEILDNAENYLLDKGVNKYFINWFNESYVENQEEYLDEEQKPTKQNFKFIFLSDYIFDIITYDDELSFEFGKKIYKVIKVIYDKKNYGYFEKKDEYIDYILVCNLLNKFDLIDWGTSIRTAWFNKETITCNVSRKTFDGKVIYENPTISIKELIEWLEADGINESVK